MIIQMSKNKKVASDSGVLIQNATDTIGTILGQMDRSGKKIISLNDFGQENRRNQHVVVFGNTGSGKTYSFVLPFCLQALRRRESLVINDPHGEVYEKTAECFRRAGYVVRYLNLRKPALSDTWDLLAGANDNPERLSIIANVISHNLDDAEDSSFVHQTSNLLEAILMRIVLDDALPAEEKSFTAVINHLCHPEGEKHLDDIFDPEKAHSEKIQGAFDSYLKFKRQDPHMRWEVVNALGVQLKSFQNSAIQEMLSTPGIGLTLPGKQPCVYFCSISDIHSCFNIILPLFLSLVIYDLACQADFRSEHTCKVPVNFLLDEFADCGVIPDFDRKLATMRFRGMDVCIVVTYIDQLKRQYRDRCKSLLAQCDICLCFGTFDPRTTEFISERTRVGERAAFTPEELMRLRKDECVIVSPEAGAIIAYKYPYTAHPESSLFDKTL